MKDGRVLEQGGRGKGKWSGTIARNIFWKCFWENLGKISKISFYDAEPKQGGIIRLRSVWENL